MAYREFRNEEIYDKPVFDFTASAQAIQQAHEAGLHEDSIRAQKEDKKKKDADSDLKNIASGASMHKEINYDLEKDYTSLVDKTRDEIGKTGTVSNNTKAEHLKHAQKVESAKKADAAFNEMQQRGSQLASQNPAFDQNAYQKDLESTLNSSKNSQEALDRYSSMMNDQVKYHKGDVVLQNFMKAKNNDASKIQINSSTEDSFGKTTTSKTTVKTPFPIFEGEHVSNVNGKEVKVQKIRAPESPDEIPQQFIDEYKSQQNGLQYQYEVKQISDKDKKEELKRINEAINEKNRLDGTKIPNVTMENYGDIITDKLADKNIRKKLFDLQQVDNLIDSGIKRDGSSKPAAGSLSTYKTVPVGTNNTVVKNRMRDGALSERTYHKTGKDVALVDEKGNQLKVDASNFDGINERTGQRFITTQSVEGKLSSLGTGFGIRYTDKNGRTMTNSLDIGVDKGKSATDGILRTLTDKEIEKTLKQHPDAKFEFYPEALMNIKPRKNDYSELSSEQQKDVEEYKRLKEDQFLDEDGVKRMAELSAKYEAYVDQNVSTNANNIGQVTQYARQKGYRNVMDLAMSQHTPEEKEKLRQTQMELNNRVQSVKAKMASGKPINTKTEIKLAAPKVQTIKASDVAAKAKAAGYSVNEYTVLLKKNGIKIE